MARLAVGLLGLALSPCQLAPQSPTSAVGAGTEILLARDHWAARAALAHQVRSPTTGAIDHGSGWVRLQEVALVLAAAADSGASGDRESARASLDRLIAEFASGDAPGIFGPIGPFGDFGAGLRVTSGALATRSGTLTLSDGKFGFRDEIPAIPRPNATSLRPVGFALAKLGPVSLAVSGREGATGRGADSYFAAVGAGPLTVWGGQFTPRYGPGRSGSLIFRGDVPVRGAGFSLRRPMRLPWVLRHLGDLRLETFLAPLERSRERVDPWLWGGRLSLTPHPRLSIAASRAAMFGGRGNGGFDLGDFARVLAGLRDTPPPFENQLAAVDISFLPPLGRWPVAVYVEWGAEDSAGSWAQVPGLITGARVAGLPFLAALSVTVEHVYLAGSCCGNPPWYWHGFFPGGWTVDGEALGHALGGQGHETRLGLDVDAGARLAAAADVFFRRRRAENLYAPARSGGSYGGRLRLTADLSSRTALKIDALGEFGDSDWRLVRILAGGTVRLRR
ncbi:MAG: capsule assembly Wzi family protein [Gemmatimonadota bacterium]